MKIRMSDNADRQYDTLNARVRKAFGKQLQFLLNDIRHPSLHAKKYNEATGLWQARVSKDWRFWFLILGDVYEIQGLTKHPK